MASSSRDSVEKSDPNSSGGSDGSAEKLIPLNDHRENQFTLLPGWRKYLTVGILCFINLINYMDRFTLAGVLSDIQTFFKIGDDSGGLIQTVFVVSYMIFAPLFGYLGDRYSRNKIMFVGILLWSLTTFVGSFMNNFAGFVFFRALVGIGEASYSTIAPTVISDLFVNDARSKMLALFYFAIPVGSGLGYIVGSGMAELFGSWHWALRVTPVLGVVAALLLVIFVKDPERGEAEGGVHITPSSYIEDIKVLLKNRSFIFSTLGFTCVAFVAGALAWWGPNYIYLGLKLQALDEPVSFKTVSFKFGIVSMAAGLLGVPLGSMVAQRLRPKYSDCDPIICGFGLLVSAPLVYLVMVVASNHAKWCYTFVFFGEIFLNLTWSLVADMLLYVVIPTRRSTAEAFQILVSHALGDAGSPYLIGVVSEMFKRYLMPSDIRLDSVTDSTIITFDDEKVKFKSLQYALFITCFVEVLGAIFFFITARYIVQDKENAQTEVDERSVQEIRHHNAAQPNHIA